MFRVGFLAFIFVSVLMFLGCAATHKASIFNEGDRMLVKTLDAVVLTATDLPTLEEDITFRRRASGIEAQPAVVNGYAHAWDGSQPEEHFNVQYWLFGSAADAQKAANDWRDSIAAGTVEIEGRIESVYQPEPNAEEVIGDATWRPENEADLWFVKNNVLVYIMAERPKVNQLPLTRSVARKIEAKINAALPQE